MDTGQSSKTNKECIEMLQFLFRDADHLYKTIAPEGWVNSPYIHLLHPTPRQQYNETRQMRENINRLNNKSREDIEKLSIDDFEQDDLNDITEEDAFEEFIYVFGLAVYDIFSNNHEVIADDGKSYDLGSFRGSGRFLAEFINMNYPKQQGSYDYMDFYMGSIWVKNRADLKPIYEFIFQKLKATGCDWHYAFPRTYLVDFNKDAGDKKDDSEQYNPEEKMKHQLEKEQEDEEFRRFQEDLDKHYEEAFEDAKYKPLTPLVQAYKNIYGTLPEGHPQK